MDLQRRVEVDKCRTTHPKPLSGLDESWYVCVQPPCTYLWHFKYSPPIPIEETPKEIHSDNVNMLDEWAAVRSSSFEWRERERKKKDPDVGLAGLWTCGFEQWSYLVRNTNVYSVALFTISKIGKHIKKSKNDKWLMSVRIYKQWINKSR